MKNLKGVSKNYFDTLVCNLHYINDTLHSDAFTELLIDTLYHLNITQGKKGMSLEGIYQMFREFFRTSSCEENLKDAQIIYSRWGSLQTLPKGDL